MTGLPDWNYPAFFAAEEMLKELGLEPFNPAHHNGETLEEALANVETATHSWEWYLKQDLSIMLQCDAIYPLDGWENSKGAKLEMHVAQEVDIPVLQIIDLDEDAE